MGRRDGQAGRAEGTLARITAEEERLRRKKVALLRADLAKAQARVDALQRQLRSLGDREATRSAGRIDWTNTFDRLGPTFSAKGLAELTGAGPRHVAVITHRWREDGRIVSTGHGTFRKVSGRR